MKIGRCKLSKGKVVWGDSDMNPCDDYLWCFSEAVTYHIVQMFGGGKLYGKFGKSPMIHQILTMSWDINCNFKCWYWSSTYSEAFKYHIAGKFGKNVCESPN